MTLADHCYDLIRSDIVTGVLPPGQPLKMDALKVRYGAGFSPLREALNRLQADRLVDLASSRGFRVSSISLEEMWDVIQTRILIETDAIRKSIQYGDDRWEIDVVSSLHALSLQSQRLNELDRPATNEEILSLEKRHSAFHKALIASCQSQWLLSFAEKLYVETERYRFPILTDRKLNKKRNLNDEHTRLANAVTSRDADGAAALIEAHLLKTGETLENNFEIIFPDQNQLAAG
ncbi:FCD domain-containing protein [Sneathiella chinensis]|uniref:GntR family transcriptional regulator n=1 Tax=Sneathiella chinensis TaxID=349750 RepID=A0ABQ5U4L6_9PROT|nr:FCD domain-containing protein [Sneathiella chinensis]GLQ06854.1 GntR family transcriptional regulator [Sneathiella chinensis]